MPDWFTDEEMQRIVRFAESSGYDRDPAMLLPDEATDAEGGRPSPTESARDRQSGRDGEAVVSEE